jgi:catechol 2,3-dioxygenase-like lactoylglutathione lyase family enzyme
VTIRASDKAASERFYRTVLGPLEAEARDDLAVGAAAAGHSPTRQLHIGFVAPSRARARTWTPSGGPGSTPGTRTTARRGSGGGCIDHLWIGVGDLDRAAEFYELIAAARRAAARGQLGRGPPVPRRLGDVLGDRGRPPPTSGLELAFPAPDRQTVREFHAAALAAGHRDAGAPAERAGACAARVLDPDGTGVEVVSRP